MPSEALRRAAFGDLADPDPALLAAPRAAGDRLLAAIVLGGQGRYAAAAALLGPLAHVADPVLASLALSTFASHRRQLGGHAAAFGPDGAALRLVAGRSGAGDADGLDVQGARTDALLGLAADNLGTGRLTVAHRLLARAEPVSWRSRVRLGWVTAEVMLAGGRGHEAVPPAETALEIATAAGARRHITKSQLVLAAALGATGDRERAMHLVDDAFAVSEKFALSSLSWPAGLLAADMRPSASEEYRSRVDATLHAVLRRSDPVGRRLAHESPWLPG
ncbi:hypothetical protein HFP15_35230 [Amycolatopsis sp. K13G38]|uniref:DNA-binding protein n=1 Tax=Amycolatopsis acididurans TaxID=2724524 RepID=A0ABX1JEB9_9PSEU|nr:hypothetical protein [Amycolatopsis acididurans]NKQ58125.1 hypothetical protein [Amycolatopsis acididurans]